MTQNSAMRAIGAVAVVAVLAAVLVVPLSASAVSAVTSGTTIFAQETTASVVATGTLMGVTLGMLSVPTTTAVETTGAAGDTPAQPLTVRQIVRKTGEDAGLSAAEISALMWICYRESRFHPTSVSRSECHGLFQLSAGMAHRHPWKDPVWNTKRAIRYMKGRYGGVLEAKAFWQRHHWY